MWKNKVAAPEGDLIAAEKPSGETAQRTRAETRERNRLILEEAEALRSDCIREQRESAKGIEWLRKIRPIADHTQRAYMATRPPSVFNYVERAFLLPEDYVETDDRIVSRKDENSLIPSLVFDPGSFSRTFLAGLGLLEKERKKVSSVEEMRSRIDLVPKLKRAFASAKPLSKEKWQTGRILMFDAPGEPYHRKYVLFREKEGLEVIPETDRRRRTLRVVPHVFSEVFSLVRSQEKAMEEMAIKNQGISKLKLRIRSLISEWSGVAENDKKAELRAIALELSSKETFYSISALEGRLEKIDFSHPEKDRWRLLGAWNDLMHEYRQNTAKLGHISMQWTVLREMLSEEIGALNSMFRSFLGELGKLDQKKMEELAAKFQSGKTLNDTDCLPFNLVKNLSLLSRSMQEYTRIGGANEFIGEPFVSLHRLVADTCAFLRNAHEQSDRDLLKYVLGFTLKLKTERFYIFLHEWEDVIKSEKILLPYEKDRIVQEMRDFQATLAHRHFLVNIDARAHVTQWFSHMKTEVSWIADLLLDKNYEGALGAILRLKHLGKGKID